MMTQKEKSALIDEKIKADTHSDKSISSIANNSIPAQDPFVDNFFAPLENTKPYFKAAFEGFAGSGKTYTAALVAIGLYKTIGSQKPVVIFDTEKAAKFLKPLFSESDIKVFVKESRSLADLQETMKRCREGFSDVLMIDSLSHIYEDFLAAYKRRVGREYFQIQDWGIIKPTWKREFSDPFVRDPYHAIFCGRAGYEYEQEVNEVTGKKEFIKSGIKMKVEGETAYEPDMLVLMERFEKVLGDNKEVWREATIIKDRANIIDGKTFRNPTFREFEPTINIMLANPVKPCSEAEKDAGALIKTEEQRNTYIKERKRWIEEIEGYLTSLWPGQSAAEKKLKIDAINFAFPDTRSWTEIEGKSPAVLKNGYETVVEFGKMWIESQQPEEEKAVKVQKPKTKAS